MSEFNEIFFSQDPTIIKNINSPEVIPILPVRNTVLFPFSMFPLTVGRESSIKLIEEVSNNQNRLLGVITQRDPSVDEPEEADLYAVGTLGIAAKQIRVKENNVIAVIQGLKRFRIREFVQRQPYLRARIEILEDVNVLQEASKAEAVRRSIEALFQQVISLSPGL